MIRYSSTRFAFLFSVALSVALPGGVFGTFIDFSVGGNNTTASIQATVDAFRAAAGNPNNGNAPGPLDTGRREINWDGGGSATTISGNPFNGFQNIRGASFTAQPPGIGFIQAPPSGGAQGGFATFFNNPNLGTSFGVFSPQRIFSPIDSNITDVSFFIPGSNGAQAATVGGFGAIFTDVDLANTTRLQFFDSNNSEIYNRTVPPGSVSDASLSFLGALGTQNERVARVRITTGNAPIGSTADNPALGIDLVAMDDFIYPEPVPESGGFGLMLLGLGAVLLYYRRWLAVS